MNLKKKQLFFTLGRTKFFSGPNLAYTPFARGSKRRASVSPATPWRQTSHSILTRALLRNLRRAPPLRSVRRVCLLHPAELERTLVVFCLNTVFPSALLFRIWRTSCELIQLPEWTSKPLKAGNIWTIGLVFHNTQFRVRQAMRKRKSSTNRGKAHVKTLGWKKPWCFGREQVKPTRSEAEKW